jgi:hypothetical protein
VIHNPRLAAALRKGLPLASAATLLVFFAYLVGQQVYRTSANDPQIQIAEDAAGQLTAGARPDSLVDETHLVDVATSLAPWTAIYDDSGNVIASSARLHGAMPQIPAAIFAAARDGSEQRVTLQPEGGVRAAVVIARYTGGQPGYVAVGRSLREVDIRQGNLLSLAIVVWFVTLLAIFATYYALEPKPVPVSEGAYADSSAMG